VSGERIGSVSRVMSVIADGGRMNEKQIAMVEVVG
jgi:hypothetical protein